MIRSGQNPAIQRARAVGAGKERGFLLLEGDRLVDDALRRGLALELCLVATEREDRACELEQAGAPVRRVEADILRRASQLVTAPGVLAVGVEPEEFDLAALDPATADLVAVACGISDPGNLGALARTAEAAGAGGLILIGGASPWNSKALRGSMGSLLRLPVSRAQDATDVVAALAGHGYHQFRAATRDGIGIWDASWPAPVATWFTSETGELPAAAQSLAGITIPMGGEVESLNVTTAAALLLFAARHAIEAKR